MSRTGFGGMPAPGLDAAPSRLFFEEHLRASRAARDRFSEAAGPRMPRDIPSEPEPPPKFAAEPASPAALCPGCGNCTRSERCEGCGADMSEALALWRGTGVTPEGLPVRDARGRPTEAAVEAAWQAAEENDRRRRAAAFGRVPPPPPVPPPAEPTLEAPPAEAPPDAAGSDGLSPEIIGSVFSMLPTTESDAVPAAGSEAVAPSPIATPPEILERLPVTILERDGQECAVCLNKLVAGEKVLTLPCFHVYHQARAAYHPPPSPPPLPP